MSHEHITYHITSLDKGMPNTLTVDRLNDQLLLTFKLNHYDCLPPSERKKAEPYTVIVSLYFPDFYLKKMGLDLALLGEQEQETQTICCHTQLILHEIISNKYPPQYKKIFIETKALELLLYLANHRQEPTHALCDGCKFLNYPVEKDKIEEAKSILLENLASPPTIPYLALQVGINQCYLKRGFKQLFGMTILEFVLEQKMKKAQLLMKLDQHKTIAQIAEDVGYSSIANFTNAFKRLTGITPSEYLKKNQGQHAETSPKF